MSSLKTVLVIDDDKDVVSCMKDALNKDFRVLTAFDGKSGMDLIKQESISLIVLDYCLPDMDGIDILKAVRQGLHIPVIMITAHGDKDLVLKSWRYRADYYFDKPFSLADLRKRVRELLGVLDKSDPLAALNCEPSVLSPDIHRVLLFIRTNLADILSKRLSLKDIAENAMVSPKHLSRLSKKELGQSIFQIISALRLGRAKELLESGKNIKEVGLELGFRYPNNFSKFMMKITGRSASELRKLQK